MSALTNAARDPRTALVLFSGGQDSTTCLAWALERFQRVETLGFDYGQRHHIELQANGLPNTFVPGRNLLFLGFAATLAYRRGASVLVGGMCETDYSGYPDCRDNTMKALQVALSLGLDTPMTLETPLMFLTKAQTWDLAEQLGGQTLVELIVEHTHTCYLGERGARHPWGHGCGHCPACELRRAGHAAWLADL